VDYAGDRNYLESSLPFFKMDLEILHPDILILPKTIYAHRMIKDLIAAVVPDANVIPVFQFNSTVVHIHLKKNEDYGARLATKWKGTTLNEWTNHLTGYKKGSPYWYYAELESVLSQRGSLKKKTEA